MKARRLIGMIGVLAGLVPLAGLAAVFAFSEWKLQRTYDAPLEQVNFPPTNLTEGRRMAEIIGCWAGCHGTKGEGGVERIEGVREITAPTLSDEIRYYSDAELVRLIRYGVMRDGRSTVGMSAYTFWPLGTEDLANVIGFLRRQPLLPPVERVRRISLKGRWGLVTGDWDVSAAQVDRSIPRWGNLPRETAYQRGRYLASITCSECHGLDFRGHALEGGPSLQVVAAYDLADFRRLMRTGTAISGRVVEKMAWLADVNFRDREIADIYTFLRNFHEIED